MKHFLYIVFTLLVMVTKGQPATQKLKVMLVGTFHFNNPGLDVAKFKDANILSARRQNEVEELVKMLKLFAPDKIFIEASTNTQWQIDSSLQQYKAGRKILAPTETEQIGFRLAHQLGLSTLHAVDYQDAAFPFDSLMKSAIEARQTDLVRFITNTIEAIQQSFNEALLHYSIPEMLLRENSEEMMQVQHQFYFKLLLAGKPGNHVGAYLVSEWWRRNMVIYENIVKQLDGSEKRIMVIFGSGHTAILHQLMQFNPQIEQVPVSAILRTLPKKNE